MAAKKKARKSSAPKQKGGRKKGTAPAAGSKTAFVLSLPPDTSAKEVVAKAKEKGITLSEAHVYTIRSTAKRGAGKSRAARADKASSGPASNKAEFFRSLPAGISFAEASQKAKAAGFELSRAYFYVLKSELKKKGGAGASRGVPAGRRGGSRKSLTTLPSGLMLTSRDPHEKAVLEAVEALGAERVRNVITTAERLLSARA